MELAKQVCSLGLSKQLKSLGLKQESLWYWIKNCNNIWILVSDGELSQWDGSEIKEIYSAYTVAELLEDMPSHIKKGDWGLTIQKTPDVGYMVNYQNGFGECWEGWDFCNLFLANSLARMKIRLKKEGLL